MVKSFAALKINIFDLEPMKSFVSKLHYRWWFQHRFPFLAKEERKTLLEKGLQLNDVCMEEIYEYFLPCAVDPSVCTLLTASYGYGGD
jgi:hypothetical protein